MTGVLPSLFVLGSAAVAAIYLALSRSSRAVSAADRNRAAKALAITVAVQSIHFIEEARTGFHVGFPALLGLPPMPYAFFLAFNLLWITIWIASIPGLSRGNTIAFFAAWFLAIVGILNGIAHPAIAIATNGYFPGVISSPLVGLAGIGLWIRLRAATN